MAIKCGNCRGTHEKAAEVRDCYAISEYEDAEAVAELEAERRNEQFFEEGPESFRAMRWAEEQEELSRIGPQNEAMRLANGPIDEEVAAAARLDRMAGVPGRDMASDKQVKYALDLLKSHAWPDNLNGHDLRNMERRQVSKLIDQLKLAPRKQGELNLGPEVGMYIDRDTDTIYRFYHGQRSGRVLAKRLVEDENGYHYQYVGVALKLQQDLKTMRGHQFERMDLDEAKEWGRMTGTCCVCGHRLDVPESVDAGIGPVCARKDIWS